MSYRIAEPSCRWQNLRVPYIIDNNDFPDGDPKPSPRKEVEDGIQNMIAAGVELVPKRQTDNDYIVFRSAINSCSSPVGRQGGAQEVRCNVAARGWGPGSVMHEICHALGLFHEHQRSDRDDKVIINQQDPSYNSVNYAKQIIVSAIIVDDYDFGSIMHYPLGGPLSLKPGVAVPAGVRIGQRNSLSLGDIRALLEMKYGSYIGSTGERSDARSILVQSTSGAVSVTKGDRKRITLPDYRFWWYSGKSREWTTTPFRTNVAVVYRERDGRRMNWACYHDPSLSDPEVGFTRTFLGNEHDKCSHKSLYVEDINRQRVRIAKGETREVKIRSRRFKWWCGGSKEWVTAPRGTNMVVVTRAPRGRSVTWACYKVDSSITSVMIQRWWRWCNKCQGLWFGGRIPGDTREVDSSCPAGGFHTREGSGRYALIHNTPRGTGRQDYWRWCNKCQGCFYGRNHPNPSGRCPADGGSHDSSSSGEYSLVHNEPSFNGQHNWRFCWKCEGLFYAGHGKGVCPAGGGHDATSSGQYALIHW